VGLKVGPPPHPTIDNMRKSFSMGHLESAVETPGDGDTLGGTAWVGERRLQRLDGALCLLQLLHQGVHCLLSPLLLLVALLPAQQALDSRRGEGEEGVDASSHSRHHKAVKCLFLFFTSQTLL